MIELLIQNKVAHVTLNRPDVFNSMNAELLEQLIEACQDIEHSDARIVVLKGSGSHFCAGADLNWMQAAQHASIEENFEDAQLLGDAILSFYELPMVTICAAHGKVMGGGVGLASAADIVIADANAQFCLSEAKLGLIPAVITPYVIERIGAKKMFAMLALASFTSAEVGAQDGLVDIVSKDINNDLQHTIARITQLGPVALKEAKALLRHIDGGVNDEIVDFTASVIAQIRTSEEGREGIAAFLEKRKPAWSVS